MAPRGNRKNILKYFNCENGTTICKMCSQSLKGDRIFNLKTHLIKVHKIKEEELCDEKNSAANSSNGAIVKKCRKEVIKIDISKKQLFQSYIGLVTEDSVPFNVLNSKNMRSIVDPICRGLSAKHQKNFMLNSNNCKKVLKDVSDTIRDSIKAEVKQRMLSLKIDSATRLSRNVFGISAQFISNNEIHSRILGMVELKGLSATSSRNLATEIIKTLTKYEVSLSQIVSITSDNGANMIKTTKMLSHCGICNEAHEGLDADDSNEIYLQNINIFENSTEIHLGDIKICRCAAHTAQLCALDVMKDSEIKTLLLNCRDLVIYIKKPSNGYRDIFDSKQLTLPQLDCPTKWGSTYNMIVSLKNAKDVIQNMETVSTKSVEENLELGEDFWRFVEGYSIAFAPLQCMIVKFQQEQLHYGNFYAEWLKCKICTEKLIEEDNNTYKDKIVKSLLRNMENRMTKLMSNELLISCLYLDPRFHHTLTSVQKVEAATYLKKLYERVKLLNVNIAQRETQASLSSSLEENAFSHKNDEYLNEYLTKNFVPKSNEIVDIYAKIENLQLPFIRADSNILNFWRDKQYSDPELYALSNIIFAVPPIQVTIERAFSSLKLVLADNRNRMNQDTLENILMVKLNPSLLGNAIDNLPLFEGTD